MKRKALFIGGTGTISSAITRLVASLPDWDLTLLNRGQNRQVLPDNVEVIHADIHHDDVAALLGDRQFDVVADFIIFDPADIDRDFRLFGGRTRQYIFISSASAYQKPVANYLISESTPLVNPYWQYSRDKATCEDKLHRYQREEGFPVTIVRPSHTYCERSIPVAVHGDKGSWQVIRRMMQGKPVIIHGDGSSLWTLTHNTDFARAFVALMGNVHAIGNTIQIMGDETLSWLQIHTIIAEALGVELHPCFVPSTLLAQSSHYDLCGNLLGDKTASVVFDITKLRRLVPDFTATVRFDQGVRMALDYIRQHPECQQEDPEFDLWCDKVVDIMGEVHHKIQQL